MGEDFKDKGNILNWAPIMEQFLFGVAPDPFTIDLQEVVEVIYYCISLLMSYLLSVLEFLSCAFL